MNYTDHDIVDFLVSYLLAQCMEKSYAIGMTKCLSRPEKINVGIIFIVASIMV